MQTVKETLRMNNWRVPEKWKHVYEMTARAKGDGEGDKVEEYCWKTIVKRWSSQICGQLVKVGKEWTHWLHGGGWSSRNRKLSSACWRWRRRVHLGSSPPHWPALSGAQLGFQHLLELMLWRWNRPPKANSTGESCCCFGKDPPRQAPQPLNSGYIKSRRKRETEKSLERGTGTLKRTILKRLKTVSLPVSLSLPRRWRKRVPLVEHTLTSADLPYKICTANGVWEAEETLYTETSILGVGVGSATSQV